MREILNPKEATGPLGPVVSLLDKTVLLVCASIIWLTFVAMLLPTFVNAVLRYTSNKSLIWSVEIVQLVFPWFIMAGAILAAQHGRHIGVDLIVRICPKQFGKWMTGAVQLIILIACGAVCYVFLGLGMFEGGMEFAAGDVAFTSLGVSQFWSYTSLLFGYFFLGITSLTTVYRIIVED